MMNITNQLTVVTEVNINTGDKMGAGGHRDTPGLYSLVTGFICLNCQCKMSKKSDLLRITSLALAKSTCLSVRIFVYPRIYLNYCISMEVD